MNNKNLTKKERREAARERARKIAEQEAKRAQRTKLFTILGIILAVAIVGLAIFGIVKNRPTDARVDFEAPFVALTETTSEAGINDGFELTSKDEAVAEDAQTVSVYFDYMCSHCNNLEKQFGYQLADLVETGKVKLDLHPVSILNSTYSTEAAQALHYISQNAPEYTFKFHTELFSLSDQVFSGKSTTEPGWPQILDAAKEAGIPEDVVAKIQDGVDPAWLDGANEAFRAQFRGTPTVLLNGEETSAWASQGFYGMLGLEDPTE